MPHSHNIIDKDNHFIIDPVTRKIQPENHEKNKLVEGDHNSEKYTFEIPQLIEGHDMSQCNVVQIHYLNVSSDKSKKTEDVYEVDDLGVLENKENKLAFTWTIKEPATRYNGLLSFAITFKCTTNDTVDYAWHTEIYSGIIIGKGMNNAETIIIEYSDILEKWKEELFSVDGRIETATRKSLEDIEKAKNESLSSIAQHGTVQVSDEEPTDPNVDLYINPDETISFSVPEIKDDVISDEDTWSSTKINQEFQSVSNKQIESDKETAKLKEDLTGLEEATLEKIIIEFIAKKELQQNTPIFNNVEILKVDIKKNTNYTIKTNDVDEIIVGRSINLYEKYTDGRVDNIGNITGNGSINLVAKNDIVSINIFVEGKNIAKNGVIEFKAAVVKENLNSIESIVKNKVDSGYRVRRGAIFEIGSVTGNNVDISRARSIPIRGIGVVSVKNIVKNNLLVSIRVWSDNPFGTIEFDSGWQKIENLIEYDVTNKYYSIGICHQDYVSEIEVNKLNSLGIKIYEKIPTLLTDEIISDIDYRLTRIEQQQQRTAGTIRNIAHRGDDIYAPQNTAPAYIEARKRGFTVGENDVAISKDGVYVVWHDIDLSRISISGFLKDINGYDIYTDGTDFYYKNIETGIIYTYTNEYIQSDIEPSIITQCKGIDYSVETLPYNVLSRIDFGLYMGAKFKGTKILTFEEWILLCKQLGMEVYIDKKFAYSDESMEYLYNIVKKYGMLDKATWLDPLFDKLRSLDPNARMCTLTNPTSSNIIEYKKYNTGRGFFFNGDGKTVTQESVQLGLNAGFDVEVWYVDYGTTPVDDILQKIRNIINYGCTGISTDHYTVDDAFRYLLQ